MGSTMWCRNCSKSGNHVGLWGNFGKHKETGDHVYACTRCGHLRTYDIVELDAGTEIEHSGTGQVETLERDGWLEEAATA